MTRRGRAARRGAHDITATVHATYVYSRPYDRMTFTTAASLAMLRGKPGRRSHSSTRRDAGAGGSSMFRYLNSRPRISKPVSMSGTCDGTRRAARPVMLA
jgi:hypothetical protein